MLKVTKKKVMSTLLLYAGFIPNLAYAAENDEKELRSSALLRK